MNKILISLLLLINFQANAEIVPYDEKTFYKQYEIQMSQEQYDEYLKNSFIIINKTKSELEYATEKNDQSKMIEKMCLLSRSLNVVKTFSEENITLIGAKDIVAAINETQTEPVKIQGNTLETTCNLIGK